MVEIKVFAEVDQGTKDTSLQKMSHAWFHFSQNSILRFSDKASVTAFRF